MEQILLFLLCFVASSDAASLSANLSNFGRRLRDRRSTIGRHLHRWEMLKVEAIIRQQRRSASSRVEFAANLCSTLAQSSALFGRPSSGRSGQIRARTINGAALSAGWQHVPNTLSLAIISSVTNEMLINNSHDRPAFWERRTVLRKVCCWPTGSCLSSWGCWGLWLF